MIAIRPDDPTAPHVADLLAFHLAELRGVMSPEFAFALDARELAVPGISFWTAWTGPTLAGFAALKQLDPAHGEVKSMRAAPAARGTGVGRALIVHIIAEARARGYRRLSLETGSAATHDHAVSLYRSVGFVACNPFAAYAPSPHNQFMTLDLGD